MRFFPSFADLKLSIFGFTTVQSFCTHTSALFAIKISKKNFLAKINYNRKRKNFMPRGKIFVACFIFHKLVEIILAF